MTKLALASAFAIAIASLAPSAALAAPTVVPSSGSTFDLDFDNRAGIAGVTANILYQFSSTFDNVLNQTIYTLNYTVTNTSTTDSLITAFGFDTNPELADADAVSGIFDNIILDAHAPDGVQSLDFCATGGNGDNNCSGIGSVGVEDGDDTSGVITLAFAGNLSSITLDGFYVRYQSIGPNDLSTTGAPIPEPGEWAMILAGLGIVGFIARRRRESAIAA